MSSPQVRGSRVAPLPPVAGGTRAFALPDLGRASGEAPANPQGTRGGFAPLILGESREDPRDRAEREAEAMLAEAQAQAQAIGEQARREGYEAGYQSGQEEGRAASQARVEAACDNLGRALKVLDLARAGILAVMENEMVALVQAACDRILLAPEAVDPALVKRVVREAVLKLGEAERVTVSLHPDDLALVREFRPRLLEEMAGLTRLDTRPDPSLRPGDCRVDSADSHVDATLESRRQRIFQLLSETLSQGQRPDMNHILDEALERDAAHPGPPVSPPEPPVDGQAVSAPSPPQASDEAEEW